MDFIDLKTQQARIQEKIKRNIQKVLNHGSYILGPEVKDLEEKLAKYVGVKHAIACASGTDALLMALMAYDIKPGDAIFTTPFTFIATAEVIALLGATPIFVDIDPKTYNIDPAKLDLAIKALKNNDSSIYPLPNIEHRTLNFELTPKGIIPVDLFGLLADYEAIQAIADEHHLFVIEDAAQSFGAQYENKMSCSYGNIACTSFFPAKPLGCYGDGGMCFTNDNALADKMNSIKVHGKGIDKYENIRIGINGRLDTLQAAILLAKFDIFPEELVMRQTVARRYTSLLTSDNSLLTPCIPPGNVSAWAQYSLLTGNENNRTVLLQKLQDNQIPSAIYYPKSLHMQTAFAYLGYQPGDFPVSENCSTRIFSIPMHPYLNEKQQAFIADIISAGGQPMT
ncbi:MAG TPA: DegT/DnrJ/EryC1/StrS aminotransferase family protein [Smithella sp.]|nr:DegT/DnrJ/EryC1/StrS aminotransferase family protein [Smithella sp.]HNY51601.1 DegT/DnrJ/EryC1/StrS aminotransferase family protein [Smithella sp.]HOG91044.1 DegT/DnrJ/EryC1/StrS aminotransferase family protein [Smithella sp.]HQG66636.1 DegT/DnrJ/EryC1/StrS aminotransferase family protein [Smithella sp.]HQP24934.1 DegT/DnrJ/EryC1/StrS aminotransferase family protein [Smithellaceae bacterium]